MEVQEFQKKLSEICAFAAEKGNVLSAVEIRDFFAGMNLDTDQMLKVLQYLKVQGIAIEGMDVPQNTAKGDADTNGAASENTVRKQIPLTSEEQAYLKEYKASLNGVEFGETVISELFARMQEGNQEAKDTLTGYYLRVVADMAVEYNCEEIFLGDLIQEGTVGLLTALENPVTDNRNDEWLRGEIKHALTAAVEEQTQRKFEDDCLVAKVENLEAAIKDLTDDEDGTKSEFSVGELAIILDMDVEEIKGVLRLTGEE